MTEERSKFGNRLKRYVKVSGVATNLATKLVGQRILGIEINKEQHAGELFEALGNLKGPVMKIAQILSTVPGALPQEYSEKLSSLQADAPPMGWFFVKRRMRAELGENWEKNFLSFSKEAISSASLGQVHKAIGKKNNKEFAIKVQYPEMKSVIDADLEQLKLAFKIYKRFDKSISTEEIYKELSVRLNEELDYEREAKNIFVYKNIFEDEKNINIPNFYKQFSTKKLLTMDWMNGFKVMDWLKQKPSQEDRNTVAMNMFRAWYIPFYYYGVIHGDPHLGNYSINKKLEINLMDFGSIRFFKPKFVQGVIDLYKAIRDKDKDLAVSAYEKWGFVGLDKEAISVLNLWAEFIYGPLLEDRVRPIQQMRSTADGRKLVQKVHAEIKRLGKVVQPPKEFVLMDRAAIGLGSVFMHLSAEINWHNLFHELIDNYDVEKLEMSQNKILKSSQLSKELIN